MKLLSGSELAGYIKERQARQVRALRQADGIIPRLAIIQTIDDPVIDTYVRMKQRYGQDILVEVNQHRVAGSELSATIAQLNDNPAVHGIIIQLPLADPTQTEAALNAVAPQKDVDGLSDAATFTPATAMAIDWLAAGYNVSLQDKTIALIGEGRLVGAPLARLWRAAGYNVRTFDKQSGISAQTLRTADVIVTAAGVPGLITSDMIKPRAVVIDAATSAEHSEIVGDIDVSVRHRNDLVMTPEKGGVGPLTVCALFDNVLRAARASAGDSA